MDAAAISAESSALHGLSSILGCPYASITAFESACAATSTPACLTDAAVTHDAACCASIASYDSSLANCFEANYPKCLDTTVASSLLAATSLVAATSSILFANHGTFTFSPGTFSNPGTGIFTNPCAAYATPGHGLTTPAPTTTAKATSGGNAVTGSGESSTTATGSGTSTGATKASAAASKAGAGVKVYIGVALVGALAVLRM